MTDERISELVRKRVNKHGELHLDKVLTGLLLKWLVRLETTVEDYEKRAKQLAKIVDGLKNGGKL